MDYDKCIVNSKENEANQAESVVEAIVPNRKDPASEHVEKTTEITTQVDPDAVILEDSVIIPTVTVQSAIQYIGRERIDGFRDGFVGSEEG